MVRPTSHAPRLLVVGNGMASHALCDRLVRLGIVHEWRITIVGEEPRPAYDRVHLTEFFSGRTAEGLELAPRTWYAEHGIDLITGSRVVSIDRARRIAVTAHGDELHYDQLVLATGSRPFVPPAPGIDLPKIFVYRTIEDLEAIQACGASAKTAAVIGGGLLGLEAAKALVDLGLQATVLEAAGRLLSRQLNDKCAATLLGQIEALGCCVRLVARTERIEAQGEQLAITLAGGESLVVDMIVVSAGIRPRDELAKAAGLECGPHGGVVVDDRLRTADPCIWAIGECASHRGTIYGLVGPAMRMAQVLAENLRALVVGESLSAEFSGASRATQLKLMGVDVATIGKAIDEADDAALLVWQGDRESRTLLVHDFQVVGAIGVGPWPQRDALRQAIDAGLVATSQELQRFEQSGNLWPEGVSTAVVDWPDSATVCSCLGVTRGELAKAQAAGAATSAELATATGASTVCGSCRSLLCELAGEIGARIRHPGRRVLLGSSIAVLVLAVVAAAMGPAPVAASVEESSFAWEVLWRDPFTRKTTGAALVTIAAVGLLLSVRKRLGWLQFGSFGFWRGVHAVLGVGTLVGFAVHTGLRFGGYLTFLLGSLFATVIVVGAAVGCVAALEPVSRGAWSLWLRQWRPRLVWLHIGLFVPVPLLLLFHVISVFYY